MKIFMISLVTICYFYIVYIILKDKSLTIEVKILFISLIAECFIYFIKVILKVTE